MAELVARLVGAGLLGIVGPSGSGKSSLLRAGLLPAAGRRRAAGQRALAAGADPARRAPAGELARGLRPTAPIRSPRRSTRSRPAIGCCSSSTSSRSCSPSAGPRRSAPVRRRARRGAQTTRGAGAWSSSLCAADFYGRCAALPRPRRAARRQPRPRGPDAGRGAAPRHRAPGRARRPGGRAALVDALVAGVADEPGGLPLLSTRCSSSGSAATARRCASPTTRRSGGVQGAVARLAEDAYGRLTEGSRSRSQKHPAPPGAEGEGEAVVRRRAPLAELDVGANEDVARAFAVLADSRLVTVSEGTVEVAHEALLREWPRLRAVARGGRAGPPPPPAPDPGGRRMGRGRPRPGRAVPRRPAGLRARLERRARPRTERARAGLHHARAATPPSRRRTRAAHEQAPPRPARRRRPPPRRRRRRRNRRRRPARPGPRRGDGAARPASRRPGAGR